MISPEHWQLFKIRLELPGNIIVRHADDSVVGFKYKNDAEKFLKDLTERMGKFGLELHPDKTRLIEFGRFAEANRRERGKGKP